MVMDLQVLCRKAADLLGTFPKSTRIRLISHYDADGIAAAGVLCSALHEQGYEFLATLMRNPFTKGLDRLKIEKNELIIFSDMGSGQIETIEKLGCPLVILDHHQPLKSEAPDHVVQINAHLCGIDGNYDVSGATLSYAFVVALNKKNERLAPLALAGATGDKQYLGGYHGYNLEVLQAAVKNGYLQEVSGVKLSGGSLTDALYYSIDPFYKGLSGNTAAIQELLKQLHIENKKTFEELTEDEKKKLQSYLLFILVKAGCQSLIIDEVIRKRYYSKTLGFELERFADLLDACGKNGHRSLGLALCLGNNGVVHEAEKIEQEYKQKILDELKALETNGVQEMKGLRYFYSKDSSLGGVIGGIAMNYILDEKKPLISLAVKNSEVHVSGRGNQLLVAKGLDLGLAMKTVAEDLKGHGGGHKIASGATIAANKEKEFLERLDELVSEQLKGDK